MKILQMVHTLEPSVGGVAPALLALSRGLSQRGHSIDIVTLDEPHSCHTKEFCVHPLGPGLTSYRYSSKLLPWLRKQGQSYDRVIVNGLWQYVGLAAWRRFGGSPIPYYVFPHGMLDPWFKRAFPLKHLKKWLYWPWGDYRILRDAAAVIFTSEEERVQASKSFWLYKCRERVSPLGLEAPSRIPEGAKQAFLDRYPQLKNIKVLLFLGRLHPKKGCDLLIDAMARVSQTSVSLVLAGPDQVGWQRRLQQQAASLGLTQRIIFTGMLEGDMKQGALAAADALVLPSHQENFGMSVVEALAAGLPVLISDRINIWREIDADRAGYVESDDFPGTTRLIERWMQTPPEQREAMRRNARECFSRRFTLDRAVDSLLQVLNEVNAPL
ncbi:MAG: glycosyltransferase [Verrucomicrobiota bacterium]